MSLIWEIATGVRPTHAVREDMVKSMACIRDDPSYRQYLPAEFMAVVDEWVDFVIARGGVPLRALWIATAVRVPQIWRVVNADAPPWALLNQQMLAYARGKRGFGSPERYLLAVVKAFVTQRNAPLPAVRGAPFVPRRPLRPGPPPAVVDPDTEQRAKTSHHIQLQLHDQEGSSDEIAAISRTAQQQDYVNLLLVLITRSWTYSFREDPPRKRSLG